jgi:valine dehydrogenase (NAD+)
MDVVARECDYVTGRTVEHGGSGDSSVLTAFGVFQGMRAAAEFLWGTPTVAGRRVGVAGVGKVGHHLVEHLLEDGAEVVITDVYEPAIAQMRERHPEVEVAKDTDEMVTADIDVYAPCALGNAINDDTVQLLKARIICGAANNQLAHPGIEEVLESRGILYAPDFCVNAGGLVQVSDEFEGFSFERAKLRAAKIFDTTKSVLEAAADEGIPAALAADRLAERRMSEIGRLRGIWLPR